MNPAESINPAEQVERIREILVGRDLHLVNTRIQEIEGKIQSQASAVTQQVSEQLRKAEEQNLVSQKSLQAMTSHIRQQLEQESMTRGNQVKDLAKKIDSAIAKLDHTTKQLLDAEANRNQHISKQIDSLSSEMASRIDAHSRQIMEHMHREIQQWKNKMDGQISHLDEIKVDKGELTSRIASAAMGDAVPPSPPTALPRKSDTPNLSSLDAFAMPTDSFTS